MAKIAQRALLNDHGIKQIFWRWMEAWKLLQGVLCPGRPQPQRWDRGALYGFPAACTFTSAFPQGLGPFPPGLQMMFSENI